MPAPLTITITINQPDNVLERGPLLTETNTAVQALIKALEKHKPTITTAEGPPVKKERKPRTQHPVAELPNGPAARADLLGGK